MTAEPTLTQAEKATVYNEAKAAEPQETVDILVDAGVIETKPWWQSIGINGSLVTLIPAGVALVSGIARAYGWEINEGAVVEAIMGLLGLIAAGMTWWGRVSATQPISRTQVMPGVTLEKTR